ncbi:DNA polymerase III subunit delta [Helicobacter mesocricetorum]|uniref:DNA polymerase III subunit delta n=1 Tax=Helicobacter mesocricetorum TaxID=87012 RepID=UPI000CF0590E|nr:DNA polymerase III subunit delta [Helicobacter mesocricetorum]
MYQKELEVKLAKNTLIRAILLYGEDSFLIEYYGEKIAQKLLEQDCEKNSFYFNDFDYESALSCLSQGSLFGDSSLVWVKIDKKIPKKQLDSLLATLQKTQSGHLVLEFYQADNKTPAQYAQDYKAMSQSFKGDNFFEVRFFKPNLKESLNILREFATKFELRISDFLLKKILEQQNFDLNLALAELRKYCIFDEEINTQIVDSLGYGLGNIAYEEILELLLTKRPYYQHLEQFLEQGFEEVSLINEIQRYFFTLFLFASHIKLYGNITSEEVLGYKLPQALLDKKKNLAIRLNESQYQKIFYRLNKWREESIKGKTKGNGFLNVLIKIEAILK